MPALKWVLEKIKEEALKYKTRSEFQKNNRGAYKAALRLKIINEVCSHMSLVHQHWTDQTLHEEALKYNSRKEFVKRSNTAYQIAKNRKILDKVCSHMEKKFESWKDREKLQKEALKYKTRSDFAKYSGSAYRHCLNNNLLDLMCSHMEFAHQCWESLEKIKKESEKYKTRTEFRKKSPKAYGAALRKGIIDEICTHMRLPNSTSNPEKELFDIIKSIYPKTQKIRDRKGKITNKPHIQGFDIDIYIPELRKGIEFNGNYWHSIQGLKRGREHWPEEDLVNYHEIKDLWFLNKGIKILHIKEEDWQKDSQNCINKCLKFLNTKN